MIKVGIIGAGSIGLLFAAYLSKTCGVTVYTRTRVQAEAINHNGVVLKKGDGHFRYDVYAVDIDHWNGKEDVIIVAVKQYQIKEIIEKIAQNQTSANILFLQNGMGHLKLLSSMKGENILLGSVEHGALKENAYTVKHNGAGVTNIALFSGDFGSVDLFSSLVPVDFPVRVHENYYEMLLSKLIVNSVINPLTAILQVQNGMLLKNSSYYEVLKELFSEITFILDLVEPELYFQKIIEVCENTAQNRSSMLRDIEAGRKTEVDAILGFLLDEAQRKEKQAPITKTLYYLVKGKEK